MLRYPAPRSVLCEQPGGTHLIVRFRRFFPFLLVPFAAMPLLLRMRAARLHGQAYYLDCSAPAQGDGSRMHPWNSLAAANSFRFTPGDQLLLKRGTTCRGMLHPSGPELPALPL